MGGRDRHPPSFPGQVARETGELEDSGTGDSLLGLAHAGMRGVCIASAGTPSSLQRTEMG